MRMELTMAFQVEVFFFLAIALASALLPATVASPLLALLPFRAFGTSVSWRKAR